MGRESGPTQAYSNARRESSLVVKTALPLTFESNNDVIQPLRLAYNMAKATINHRRVSAALSKAELTANPFAVFAGPGRAATLAKAQPVRLGLPMRHCDRGR
jgi:hypothetical protein